MCETDVHGGSANCTLAHVSAPSPPITVNAGSLGILGPAGEPSMSSGMPWVNIRAVAAVILGATSLVGHVSRSHCWAMSGESAKLSSVVTIDTMFCECRTPALSTVTMTSSGAHLCVAIDAIGLVAVVSSHDHNVSSFVVFVDVV